MADKLNKQSENAEGPWYMDTWTRVAPVSRGGAKSLNYNNDETAVHFCKQPETPEEVEVAQRAMDVCPTLAIGNDG